MSDELKINLEGVPSVPHLDEYFGAWAVYAPRFSPLVEHVMRTDLARHVKANTGQTVSVGEDSYNLTPDGIAEISMTGAMMKYASSFSQNPGTVAMRRMIRNATNNDAVKGAMLKIDSPGGTVSGTGDLADDIATLSAKKPTTAYIEDCGASAAYWIASQAGTVACNPTAIVGSIGTYMMMEDTSEAQEKKGVKCHIIQAGAMKGAGAPGTKITDEHIADAQRVVNQLNDGFVNGVAKGRKMTTEQASALNDGRVHVGQAAKALGLVDAVQTYDQAMSDLVKKTKTPAARAATPLKGLQMSTENAAPAATVSVVAPVPATLAELKAIKGTTAEFRESCSERGLTLAQAKDEHMSNRETELAQAKAELAQAKANPAPTKPGVKAVGGTQHAEEPTTGILPGEGKAAWDAKVEEVLTKLVGANASDGARKNRRHDAARIVAKDHPSIREAYIQDENAALLAKSAEFRRRNGMR